LTKPKSFNNLALSHLNITTCQIVQVLAVACFKVDLLRPTTRETVLRDAQSIFPAPSVIRIRSSQRHHSTSESDTILVSCLLHLLNKRDEQAADRFTRRLLIIDDSFSVTKENACEAGERSPSPLCLFQPYFASMHN
jgi:hypothetical protein